MAAKSPRISVVMSINNEPLQWIRAAIESILNQTFGDFEFIIVCDNPDFEDGIAYINETASKDRRIRLIINGSNIGPTKSFNTAIANGTGEYIARMDADDIAMHERFERQIKYLDSHPQTSVCATDAHTINESGKIIRRRRYRKKGRQVLNIVSNSISHPSVMFRRSLLELRNPIYNEEYIYTQDYELWQYLTLNGHRIHTLQEPLLLYRKSDSQISSLKKSKQVELFKRAHRAFITDWLIQHNVIRKDESSDPETMLEKASKSLKKMSGEDREYLILIIYVLYFSLGTYSWKWRCRYLLDRNLIAFRIRFIFTFRLFFSRKTRRNRTGFN